MHLYMPNVFSNKCLALDCTSSHLDELPGTAISRKYPIIYCTLLHISKRDTERTNSTLRSHAHQSDPPSLSPSSVEGSS